jgi:hypothetical protein
MPKIFLATYCGHRNANHELSASLLRSRDLFRCLGEKAGFEVVIWDEESVRQELDGGGELVRDYSNDLLSACEVEQIRVNPEWLKVGLFRWKPAIVSHMLQYCLGNGDVLVYLDCNLEKFPRYQEFIEAGPAFFLRALGRRSVGLFQDRFRRLSLDTKRIVLESYLSDFRQCGRDLPGLWAGCMVFRKDKKGVSVANDWLNICSVDNLAPLPDVPLCQRLSQYKWHSQEQSMLAVLYHRLRRERRSGAIRLIGSPARRPMKWRSCPSIYKWLRLKISVRLSTMAY